MSNKLNILTLLILILNTFSIFSQKNEWCGLKLDLNNIETRKDSFLIKQHKKVVGYWVWDVKKQAKTITIKDISVLEGMVEETFTLTLNMDKLHTSKVDMNMRYGSNILNVNLERKSINDLKATYHQKGKTPFNIKIDTTYSKNVVLRPALFGLIPTINNFRTLNTTVETFFLSSGKSGKMNLKYLGTETVKVPIGEFNTYKLEFVGDNQLSNTIYVSKSKPHRIVKVKVIGQPLTIELSK